MAKIIEWNEAQQQHMMEINQQLLALETKKCKTKTKIEIVKRALAETKTMNEINKINIYSQSIKTAAENSSEKTFECNNKFNNNNNNKPSNEHHNKLLPPSFRRSTWKIHKTKKLLSQQQQKELTAARKMKLKEEKKLAIKLKKIKQVSQFEDFLN